jgi:hypothetical protein
MLEGVLIPLLLAMAGASACSRAVDSRNDADGGRDAASAAFEDVQVARGPEDQACSLISEQKCAATPGCRVLVGRRFDRTRLCLLPLENVGCRQSDLTCGLAITSSIDASGGCWLFSNTCIPVGWRRVYGTARACTFDTPECPSP